MQRQAVLTVHSKQRLAAGQPIDAAWLQRTASSIRVASLTHQTIALASLSPAADTFVERCCCRISGKYIQAHNVDLTANRSTAVITATKHPEQPHQMENRWVLEQPNGYARAWRSG